MKKKLLSLLLALALVLPLVSGVQATETEEEIFVSGGQANPLYGETYEPDYQGGSGESSSTKAAAYVTPEVAVTQLRDAMMAREATITLYIDRQSISTDLKTWVQTVLFPQAYSQSAAQGSTDGDYLAWSWRDYTWQGYGKNGLYTLVFSMRYYTTASQEQTFLRQLKATMASLSLSDLTDYGKYCAIYQYVTAHVAYDQAGESAYGRQLALMSKKDVDISYFQPFTAYSALVEGKAVCQGYSTLIYAMCREAGLQTRVITGSNHAWNLVLLEGSWYSLDATWDAGAETPKWFLLGSKSFDVSGHTREAPFNQEPFLSQYPASTEDYVPATTYWDVPQDFATESITRVTALGLMNGTGNHRFSPSLAMQRGMLVTVLWRMEGSPDVGTSSFPDVPTGEYYSKAVAWATANGILKGYDSGLCGPTDPLTREQMVTFLYRYAQWKGCDVSASASLLAYTDRDQLATYAQAPMAWAVAKNIIQGTSTTTLSPTGSGTRNQLATILARYLDAYPTEKG
jgi:hypothetical protein